ncbi:hypothetical protein AB3S75_045822 [Citrus x aurantiifolia]
MDAEELIRKCEAITLQSEEDNMISFGGRMKAKGEKLAAHCLVGKILQSRSVSREGLRAAMQQAWRTNKEIKVESLGDNTFIFKLPSESEKKRILYGGPWHFDRSLLVITEPRGVGDVKRQDFTHASFWVQIHNMPIMCMDREIIKEIGGRIGEVQEVETDETGECISPFARVRIMVNITQPLTKRLLLKSEEDGRISLRIAYEKLPEFCFCCGLIGHSFRECLDYKGQPKGELTYGVWMRAQSRAERARQSKEKERWNGDRGLPSATVGSHEQHEQHPQNTGRAKMDGKNGSGATKTNTEVGSKPMKGCQVEEVGGGALIKDREGDGQHGITCSSKKAAETKMKQMHREESIVEGNFKENERDNAMIIETEQMGVVGRQEGIAKRHQQEEMGQQQNGERIKKTDSFKPTKTKGRKWKFQARERAAMKIQLTGPTSLKRSMEGKISPSPESKKRRMGSPTVKRGNQLQISSPSAKLKLVWEEETQVEVPNEEMSVETLSAEAGNQPRRQP